MAVSCDIHDHFEHICVLRLPVRLTLTDGREIEGRAQDLLRREGQEALALVQSSGTTAILFNEIAALKYPQPGQSATAPWRVIQLQP